MPAISSDTLFHFTSKNNLLGILENEFYPRFHLEEYQLNETTSFKIGIAMVCFCDIPLSMTYAHMANYGNYGIGMSKEWAKQNRLNPVLYLHKGSRTTQLIDAALSSITQDISDVGKSGIEIHSLTELRDLLFKLFTYTKPFDGMITLKGRSDYRKFYDEREWRYVPDISTYNGSQIMLLEGQFAEPLLSQENEKLKKSKLRFEPNDINYIIIKDESERLDLINRIDRIKEKYDHDTKRVLLSKIITAMQISQDF